MRKENTMDDTISREAAADAINGIECTRHTTWYEFYQKVMTTVEELPPAGPDKDKVSDLLYHIYSIQSPHLDMCGVIAKKYYCEELWKELFGKESELPGWMN